MWKSKKEAPVIEFLGLVLFLSILVESILLLLEPYSIEYSKTGVLTFGYALYAILGMFFSTPCPVIAMFIVLRNKEKISLKEFIKRIFYTPKPLKTILILGIFCVISLIFALFCGKSNGASWIMMPLGFIIMIPFVGIAEETGWRGFLQPSLEKKFSFPVATSITAVIWFVWHLPIWAMPTSNHYGDSLIGFAIMIFVWAFVSAAIYKSTKSVIACAIYHSFINSIGAIYDWNALFDAYPKTTPMIIYFVIMFILSIFIWYIENKKESKIKKQENSIC